MKLFLKLIQKLAPSFNNIFSLSQVSLLTDSGFLHMYKIILFSKESVVFWFFGPLKVNIDDYTLGYRKVMNSQDMDTNVFNSTKVK